jgi:hypothetical protein
VNADTAAPRAAERPLAGFIVRVFAWLPLAFAVWYVAAPVLMWPVALTVRLVVRMQLAPLVRAIEQAGATLVFVTTLGAGTTSARPTEVTVDVDMLLYAYGLPLFAALTLAARSPKLARRLAVGYVVLVPFIAFGVLAEFLKTVAIAAGPALAAQAAFAGWQRELIAVAYQLGALILPATVPAITWVLAHRVFLERLRTPS